MGWRMGEGWEGNGLRVSSLLRSKTERRNHVVLEGQGRRTLSLVVGTRSGCGVGLSIPVGVERRGVTGGGSSGRGGGGRGWVTHRGGEVVLYP